MNKKDESWNDWHWQMQNRIVSVQQADDIFHLSEKEKEAFKQPLRVPFAVTPYYAEVVKATPMRKSVIPCLSETNEKELECLDPLGEEECCVFPNLVHRYKDRVLFLVDNFCPSYCRYCTRGRRIGNPAYNYNNWDNVFSYISAHSEIRDVLISGGEPLLLSDEKLDSLLKELRSIKTVEIIRIGTKAPVTLPMRITDNLVSVLKKYPPLYLSIHACHPCEITPQVEQACNMLADAGIQLASQTVLLKGINDDSDILVDLMHRLLKVRVRPYYLFQCDAMKGLSHFRVKVRDGIKIIDEMRSKTGGFSIPYYAIDIPNRFGKIAVLPDRIAGFEDGIVKIKNFNGEIYEYPD